MSEDVVGPLVTGHGTDEAQERIRSAVKDCVHCAFCLPACASFSLWGEDMDSPRGRIHLVSQLLDGAPLTPAAGEHFDRCLGCMACMTACPSGVQYDQIIEAAREWTEAAGTPGSGISADSSADSADSYDSSANAGLGSAALRAAGLGSAD